MLSTLQKLLGGSVTPDQSRTDDKLVPVAAAMLLFEVAWADHSISDLELQHISQALQDQFGLSQQLVERIVEDAREQHANSVGVYEYTRTLHDALTDDEKFNLMVALWRLALSDSHIHRFEEHVIRKISELLYVPHTRFIAARQTAQAARQDPAPRA